MFRRKRNRIAAAIETPDCQGFDFVFESDEDRETSADGIERANRLMTKAQQIG